MKRPSIFRKKIKNSFKDHIDGSIEAKNILKWNPVFMPYSKLDDGSRVFFGKVYRYQEESHDGTLIKVLETVSQEEYFYRMLIQ